jgi:hypothetical protein
VEHFEVRIFTCIDVVGVVRRGVKRSQAGVRRSQAEVRRGQAGVRRGTVDQLPGPWFDSRPSNLQNGGSPANIRG